MMNASNKKTLAQLLLRSALSAQLFAIIILGATLFVGAIFSMNREKHQVCETARVTWSLEEEKLLQLVVMGEERGLIAKLDQIRDQGGWEHFGIELEGKYPRKLESGNHGTLAFTCSAPFSYVGLVKGTYHFVHPWKSALDTLKKYLLVLCSAIIGMLLIIVLQKRVIKREVLSPIMEIQGNLKKLAVGEPISFAAKMSCEELRDLRNSIETAFKESQVLRDEVEQKRIVEEINKVFIQIAHNIRSPLSSLDMEFDGFKDYLPAEKNQLLYDAIDRFRELANRLLQKTRESAEILSGKKVRTTEIETHALSPLIDAVAQEIKSQLPARIALQINDTPAVIKTDPVEFKSLITNLVHNSIQAISGGGLIQIQVENSGNGTVVSVQDDGCGIAPENLPKLATIGGTFGKERGIGVGLFHARTRMEEWGGRFEITSSKGMGTQVRLVFPKVVDHREDEPC